MIRLAHRGVHDTHAENSRGAVLAARESPADGIEVDCRMLGDGTVVLHHDDAVEDHGFERGASSHRIRILESLTRDEFEGLVSHDPLWLSEFLELWPGNRRAVLECKPHRNNDTFRRRLLDVLGRGSGDRNLLLSSACFDLLTDLSLRCDWPLAPILWEPEELRPAILSRPRWTELHLRKTLCTRQGLARVRDRTSRPIIAWTVNSRAERKRLEDLGIDGIMTDVRELLTP